MFRSLIPAQSPEEKLFLENIRNGASAEEIAALLRSNPHLINTIDEETGENALHIAAAEDDLDLIHVLLTHRINIDAQEHVINRGVVSHGYTAIMNAAASLKTDNVSLLQARGADLEVLESTCHQTALTATVLSNIKKTGDGWVVEKDDKEPILAIARILIEAGIDVSIKSQSEITGSRFMDIVEIANNLPDFPELTALLRELEVTKDIETPAPTLGKRGRGAGR